LKTVANTKSIAFAILKESPYLQQFAEKYSGKPATVKVGE
jgi:hypothetical protein